MTQLSRDDVLGLARLSRLQLSDAEVDALRAEITTILEYVEQLDELDTSSVEPTYQVTGLENIWREDSPQQSEGERERLLALAPDVRDNQVKVPKVL